MSPVPSSNVQENGILGFTGARETGHRFRCVDVIRVSRVREYDESLIGPGKPPESSSGP